VVDQHHERFANKTCAIERHKAFTPETIVMLNAAQGQGMNQDTAVTALADKNCWSVISHIKSHCQRLEPILDWFDKKVPDREESLGESFSSRRAVNGTCGMAIRREVSLDWKC